MIERGSRLEGCKVVIGFEAWAKADPMAAAEIDGSRQLFVANTNASKGVKEAIRRSKAYFHGFFDIFHLISLAFLGSKFSASGISQVRHHLARNICLEATEWDARGCFPCCHWLC